MTFNWFNRKLNETPDDSPPPQSPDVETAESAGSEEKPDSEQQLSFAKAAYEALKRKQQAAAQAAAQTETSAETPAEASALPQAVSEEISEAVSEVVPEVAPEPESLAIPEVSSEVVTEVVPEATPEAEAIAPALETPSAETSSAETPVVTAFWAKAAADAEARLERLRETAEPEPEPATPIAIEASPEPIAWGPDLNLDDGFIWSAEVLAAQGRRVDEVTLEEITWLKRLRQGLEKTRRGLINQLKAIVGQGPLNEDAVMEIESLLLQADVGVAATDLIISGLQDRLRQDALPPEQAIAYLKQLLRDMLDRPYENGYNRSFVPEKDHLNIWLMTGVNGAGKTTTIGKITHVASKSGYKCLIAAADTFRAAAVEQVKVWGQRSEVEVIANPAANSDPAAVVFDAISAAQARGTELLLVDTAGRLQNKKNLMDELAKIRRIIDKKADKANVEALLVLDATLGQNGLMQAKVFSEAAQLSGVVLTKLDGTAKGGIAIAVVQQLGLPIRFIGAGEGIEDLRPFSSYEFIEALVSG
jgi:fused signal recognition particle receptor